MTRRADEHDTLIRATPVPMRHTRTTITVTDPATAVDEARRGESAKASADVEDVAVEATFATRSSRCCKSDRCTGTK
jgi:hypothetical protein